MRQRLPQVGDIVRSVDLAQLTALHPTIYHMAEDGSWPSIRERGLLSTLAIVDLYQPDEATREQILSTVRRDKIVLRSDVLGDVTIRDQRPAKFLEVCLHEGVTPKEFLDALNGRVFFWLDRARLEVLLNAKLYRNLRQTVLHIDTAQLLAAYADKVQLAPYNTGSMHVPTAPKRGPDIFTPVADYPYDSWRKKRGKRGDAVVELTIPYSVPDIGKFVSKAETWAKGGPVTVLYQRDSPN